MRALYAIALLALASCAHPNQPQQQKSEPIGLDTPPVDTTQDREFVRINPAHPGEGGRSADSIIVEVHRSLIDRVFNRKPANQKLTNPTEIGRFSAGKKSTVNVFYGAATQTNSTVGKKGQAATGDGATASQKGDTKAKGGAVVTQDSSTSNALTGGGNQGVVKGNDNNLDQKATITSEKPNLFGSILSKVAWVVGIGVVGLVLYEFAWPLLLAWFRRKSSNEA